MARGRPNWWVILAVSLGLMALLVATAGSTPPASRHGRPAQAAAHVSPGPGPHQGIGTRRAASSSPATTTTTGAASTTTTTLPSGSNRAASSLVASRSPGTVSTPAAGAPVATTTTLPPPATTTTAGPNASVPADRTQTQGYIDPPLQTSGRYGFTGTGAMQISVVWSGDTYLTMEVTCPNGDQSVGGTSAMAASLPDANGSCLATVSEPASESVSLTYTISISPAGG